MTLPVAYHDHSDLPILSVPFLGLLGSMEAGKANQKSRWKRMAMREEKDEGRRTRKYASRIMEVSAHSDAGGLDQSCQKQ